MHADRLPISHELVIALGLSNAWQCALGGGDDYELAFTAPPQHEEALTKVASALAVAITRIGTIDARHANPEVVRVLDADGLPVEILRRGYVHFSG